MKGLLVKDLRLIRNSSSLVNVAFMLLFFEMVDVMGAPVPGGFGGMPVLLLIFSVNIRHYDTLDNGMACLFTLPISRREYVRECYLFAVLSSGIAIYLFAVLSSGIAMFLYCIVGGALTAVFRPGGRTLLEYAGRMWGSYKFLLFMIIFMLPFYLAANEKKRSMVLLLVGGVLVGLLVLSDGDAGRAAVLAVQKVLKMLMSFPVMLLLLAASYGAAVWVMEKKEF